MADKVFINDFEFESKYIIPIVKASRGKWSKVFYPYDDKANLIEEKDLKKDSILYNYLLDKKETLLKRSIEPGSKSNWFAFGRTQGINDTYKEKISINSLIKESKDLKIVDVKAGQGVYSGLYIISDEVSKDEIKKALLDEEFGEYVSLLGKYKSGGYYTFSSKDVKTYLDYKIGKKGVNNAN